MLKKSLTAGFIFACIMAMFTMNVSAYIDASVISYIIQGIGAVAIMGGAAVAIYWKKIKIYMKRRKEKKQKANTSSHGPEI